MKSRYILFPLLALLFGAISSCSKDFLDVPLTNEKVAEDYVVDLNSSVEFFNGLKFNIASKMYDGYAVSYADVAADNLVALGPVMVPMYNWNMVQNTLGLNYVDNMNLLWLDGYYCIRNCNFLLERIDKFRQEDPVAVDGMKAQVYAFRALIHFNLVNVFAQPYGYSPNADHAGIFYDTVYAQDQAIQRHSVKQVYEYMMADLERARQLLPTTITSKADFNLSAVRALMARVSLSKNDFQQANAWACTITRGMPLMTSANYPTRLFTNNDNESIFWFPPGQASLRWTEYQGSRFWRVNVFGASKDIKSILQERPADLRNNWLRDTAGIIQVRKFPRNAIAGLSTPEFAYNQSVFRVSEMYLVAAETFSHLGNEDSARFYLDAIRKRADITAPGPALLDSIYKERRKELCFENVRLFDLLRLKQDIIRNNVGGTTPARLTYPNDKAISPIPVNDVNIYHLSQNPGYN
jgi:starch-binding outer membrane protein, SusD/RagB family